MNTLIGGHSIDTDSKCKTRPHMTPQCCHWPASVLSPQSKMVKTKSTPSPEQRSKKPGLLTCVSPREFAKLGGNLMNCFPDRNKKDFDEHWQFHFCAKPEVCSDVLWQCLSINDDMPDTPDDKIAETCYVLWAPLLLKMCEQTEPVEALTRMHFKNGPGTSSRRCHTLNMR